MSCEFLNLVPGYMIIMILIKKIYKWSYSQFDSWETHIWFLVVDEFSNVICSCVFVRSGVSDTLGV